MLITDTQTHTQARTHTYTQILKLVNLSEPQSITFSTTYELEKVTKKRKDELTKN